MILNLFQNDYYKLTFKGKNKYERNSWVRALERVIHEKCGYYKPPQEDPIVDLHKRVTTAENQSQMLLEQVLLDV